MGLNLPISSLVFLVVWGKESQSLNLNKNLMHQRTEIMLERLKQAQWFCNVGVNDASGVEVVSSWDEAVEYCGSLEWEDLRLEAANEYCGQLFKKSKDRFNTWNDIIIPIKPVVRSLVEEKTEQVIQENSLPEVFFDTVNWDILHMCMEEEFADLCAPGFYQNQAHWYLKGHFPCGWKGEFPDGNLIIY